MSTRKMGSSLKRFKCHRWPYIYYTPLKNIVVAARTYWKTLRIGVLLYLISCSRVLCKMYLVNSLVKKIFLFYNSRSHYYIGKRYDLDPTSILNYLNEVHKFILHFSNVRFRFWK
jgi:hypothetical protein